MSEKYANEPNKDQLVNCESNIFRPTFVVDEADDDAYAEEAFQ
jgi:hypothetical protein